MTKPTLSEWLGEAVKERRWSYREASRQAGLSHNMIGLLINERQEPSTETLHKIANAFHVPHEYLLWLSGKIDHDPTADLKPEVAYIVRILSQIEDEELLTKTLDAVRTILIAIVGPVTQEQQDNNGRAA